MSEAAAFDQADIDALFGDVGAATTAPRSGIRALIETDVADQQRLPMLEVICDRMLRSFATSMRALTTDPMEVSLDGVGAGRFGEMMNRVALPAMFGVFRLEPWGTHGMLIVETGLIYAAVDALLGGRLKEGPALRVEGRAFTSIETNLVARLMEQILADFSQAFSQLAAIGAKLERIETSPRFASVVGPSIVSAECRFKIDLGGRGGRFSLLLPTTSIEPVRDLLTRRFSGETSGVGESWQASIENSLRSLPLRLDVVVGRKLMNVAALRRLQIGDQLVLDAGPEAGASVVLEGRTLAQGQLGRRQGKAALRLHNSLGKELS